MATQTEQTFLEHKCVDEIVERNNLARNTVGYIDTLMSTEKPTSVYIRGYCKESPHLINGVDEGIWKETWEELASSVGVRYSLNGLAGTIFTQHIPEENKDENSERIPKYSEIEESIEQIRALMESHFVATRKYNNRVARPYIEERKSIISNATK